MYDNTVHRDYLKTEMDYRLGRIRSDIAGHRRRRALSRRTGAEWADDIGATGTTWTR